ncbi:nuclear pore complex protein Nup155 isoform X2 [Cryptotermes secundus]|uniref:nuclear pore complex protein Nup155 isoform X2 n=1 Tax=Cryptotermes secundus TaxID=105785 RepID=UPI001454C72A|nr:nuclear pore complex protein Nup155 isoform X2 [Cryptotermes secundus]
MPAMDTMRPQVDMLDTAGKMLERYLAMDSSFPSLVDVTQIAPQGIATVSGLNDMDYPSVNGLVSGMSTVKHVTTTNRVPLPPEVMEHFGHMQCHCMMGLFTEINRAWLTIDSDIYVWTYEHGTDVAYFDGLGETIVSVGLAKPKPGVFHKFVKHLLVLTTTVEIVILGVTFSATKDGPLGQLEEMHLLPEPVFVLPTDGVAINTIASTSSGRIFLGGRDGSLYEVVYQAAGSWFGRRCKKVNHSTGTLSFLVPSFLNLAFGEEDPIAQISIDNSRNILFTLTEKGRIEVFDLGGGGMSTSKVTSMNQITIVQYAVSIVKTLDGSNFRPLASVCAIEADESSHLNLVAVTQTGVRLYFTTGSITNVNVRPYTLQLMHVRLPPGFAANAPSSRPNRVRMAHYKCGNLLLVTAPGSERDVLWCLSSDPYPFHPYLVEAQTLIPLEGIVWAMAEVQGGDVKAILPSVNFRESRAEDPVMMPDPPLVVRQHMESPRKYIILTQQGAEILQKLRPVDLLRQLLVENRGPEAEAVKLFFQAQKEEQACATSLILACLQSAQNLQVAEWATRAFFMYGGEPKIRAVVSPAASPSFQYSMASGAFSPTVVSTPYAQSHVTGSPQQNISLSTSEPSIGTGSIQYSHRHNGLYLYVGRIVRPLWNVKIVSKATLDKMQFLCSSVSREDCVWILGHLQALRNFLEKNTQLSVSGVMNIHLQNTMLRHAGHDSFETSLHHRTPQRNREQEAQLEEKHSLDALKAFVAHTCEVLGMWRILCEHQFHVIADTLSKDLQNQLQQMNFRNLVLEGQDVCSVLISSLINRYLDDNASVDAISCKLREVCPSLYRREDAACSKASEMLLSAKTIKNPEEREAKLREALQLCKSVAPQVNLQMMCQWFFSSQFYEGVLELALVYASKVDPKNVGFHFYKNKEPAEDTEGYQAYIKRMECYKEVTSLLDHLYDQKTSSRHTLSVTVSPGVPVAQDTTQISQSEANDQVNRLVRSALQSQDELMHVAVFDWLVTKQLTGDLLTVHQPSMEMYLVRKSEQSPEVCDLLWKYYEKNMNHAAAAKILHNLATRPGSSITLLQRIEYLARAVVCMRSDQVGYAPQLGVFLRELEDKIDVARIQQQVLEALTKLKGRNRLAEDAILRLNSSLLEITQLYEEFCEPFSLWECKLAIIHCSGHYDLALVETIWLNIIETELQACSSVGADDRMAVLMSKIKSLGQEYGGSPRCFPVRGECFSIPCAPVGAEGM